MFEHTDPNPAVQRAHSALPALAVAVAAFAGSTALGEETSVGGFVDEFEALDQERWFVSDGWTNGPHQNCDWSAREVSVEAGVLHLSLRKTEGGEPSLVCAEVQTRARHHYGTYEARMRVPFASGTTGTFFSFIGPPQNQPHDEIDFEFIGGRAGALQTNYHVGGEGKHEAVVEVSDAHTAFHTYAFVWEPDRLRWFVDGELVREETDERLPTHPQKIYFSLWSTDLLTDWLGPFVAPEQPLVMEVDWLAFTPLGHDCQFAASLACRPEVKAPPG